jgi:hypothetical protein
MIEVTDWAREILGKSQAAAARFNPEAKIRLAKAPGGVQALLTDAPLPTDQPVELGEMTLYVEAGLDGLVDIEEPHDRVVLKPPGSKHNSREHHS